MKPFLLLTGLLLVAGPASAQTASVAGSAAQLATGAVVPGAPDTVVALHRLFAARRQRRNLIAMGAAGAALVGTAAASSTYGRFFSIADYGKLYGLGAGLIIAVDFIANMDYSRKKE